MEAFAYRIRTVSGKMIVIIAEEDKQPKHVQIMIGKTGSNLSAYTHTLASLITTLLGLGFSLHKIIELLSNTTSDRSVYNENIRIRSDVDAVVYAFYKYIKQKYKDEEGNHKYQRKMRRLA